MSAGPQILVINDNAETYTLIDSLLQGIGMRPIWVKDGSTALALLDEGLVPSLVVLDLTLSEVDGFELLARIRKMSRMDTVPVLIIPGEADPDTIRRGLDSGADAYVTRPYIAHSFVDRVRVLLAAGRRPRPRTKFYARTTPLNAEDDISDPAPDSESELPEPEE